MLNSRARRLFTSRRVETVERIIFSSLKSAQPVLGEYWTSRYAVLGVALVCLLVVVPTAWAESAAQRLESIKEQPLQLRQFLQRMPKGGDLHNHLSGAVYAESYLRWAAEDGKCIDPSGVITLPPCEPEGEGQALREIFAGMTPNGGIESLVDALSVRNYQRRQVSGHDQFFATFERFTAATFGRRGDMVAEVSSRAASQNILYLELMQSLGMFEVAAYAQTNGDLEASYGARIDHAAVDAIVADVVLQMDQIDARRRALQGCDGLSPHRGEGCEVTVRYLSQVIRTLSPIQVYAQTLLAFKLVAADDRVVGLNFVAPEDHAVALRDYEQHMGFIAEIGSYFPAQQSGITLHAGELTLGLVPPEHLGWHIGAAIQIAGAKRIGHGIDIAYAPDMDALLRNMAAKQILVEINLTSNEVILEVADADHPLPVYLRHGVPVALSTDDEGVSRIDLTHEYQRAVTTYGLDYEVLRGMSRNALQHSFLPGERLFQDTLSGRAVDACSTATLGAEAVPARCAAFLADNPKASLQWQLETRLTEFESGF